MKTQPRKISLFFLGWITLCATHQISGGNWVLEDISVQPSASYSIGYAIDANGTAHFAYGGDQLWHSWYDGAQWQKEVVDPTPGSGGNPDLKIDGDLHIAYLGAGGTLNHAQRSSFGWSTSTIDGTPDVLGPSLALDQAGDPHIVYYNDVFNEL